MLYKIYVIYAVQIVHSTVKPAYNGTQQSEHFLSQTGFPLYAGSYVSTRNVSPTVVLYL